MRFYLFLLPVFFITVYNSNLQAFTIHVPGDEPTIQAGIDAAVDGDTVLVADGTYTGSGNKDVDFNGKAIVVMSENGYELTIIDCEDSGRGFYFHNGEGVTSVLKGFTIKNGNPSGNGGGIYCYDSSPYILECFFVNNSAGIGGGVACDYNAMPIIEECVFSGNNAGTYGGGIHTNSGSDAMITKCEFYENEAGAEGGGLRLVNSSPTVSECIVTSNICGSGGGGLLIRAGASPSIINCIISNNNADWVGGGMKIGQGSFPQIIGCVIIGNVAYDGGGIMSNNTNGPIITNCTVADNQATSGQGGGLGLDTGASATFTNSIFWGNTPDQIDIINGSLDITYSDIQGSWSGVGNIDEDPLFVGGESFDYHLQLGSPCIDAGDSTILDACRPPGLGEERSDMGAYGGEENCGWLPPVSIANFAANPTSGERPLTVNFTDLSSGSNTSWSWTFGDGGTSFVQDPVYTYNDTGFFSVSLIVSGPYGSDDTTMVDLIHVVEPPVMTLTAIPDSTVFPRGGELGFLLIMTNNSVDTIMVDGWTDVTLPSGRLISPEAGPIEFTFGPGHTINMHVSRNIPAFAPLGGPYLYCVSSGTFPKTIFAEDCFEFDVVVGAE